MVSQRDRLHVSQRRDRAHEEYITIRKASAIPIAASDLLKEREVVNVDCCWLRASLGKRFGIC